MTGAALLTVTVAAGSTLRFEHLTPEQGLSQHSANAILQDNKGFLWIGSQDGLNRFDGHTMEVFKHDPDDPDSLADSFVQGLFEDSRGGIWIIMQAVGVINRFDTHTETFKRYSLQGQGQAVPVNPRAVTQDRYGTVWIGTFGNGVFTLNGQSGEMEQVSDPGGGGPAGLTSFVISVILRDRSDALWIGTAGSGLLRVRSDGAGHRIEAVTSRTESPAGLPSDTIRALFEDRSGDLWIGTAGGGLVRMPAGSDSFEQYHPSRDRLAGSSVLAVPRAITEDRRGALWVLSDGGMTRIDPDRSRTVHYGRTGSHRLTARAVTSQIVDGRGRVWVTCGSTGLHLYDGERDTFIPVRSDPADPHSLSSDNVVSSFEDRSGLLWFGTSNGGANRFSWDKSRFRQITSSPLRPHGLAGSKVFAMLVDSSGSLWVGTLEGGLQRFAADRERVVQRYLQAPGAENDIGSNLVRAVCEDHEHQIWVGTTNAGVASIDPVAGVVRRRLVNNPEDASSLSNNQVAGIFEDRRHRLWVCTAFGLNLLDRTSGSFQRFFSDPSDPASLPSSFVRFLYQGPDQRLWLGSTGGFARFEQPLGRFTRFVAAPGQDGELSHNNIMDLYDDGRGTLWIATYGGGLNRLDLATGIFRHYTERHGLPADSLYSVVPDGEGHLWISSNRGISRFHVASETFHTFHADDGLGGYEFNGRSFWQAGDAELLFGGMHGLTSFYPTEIRLSSYQPAVVLRAFRSFNQLQTFPVAMDEVEELVLSHRDSFISFEFVALDFTKAQKNRYAYMLEGFNRDWITGNRRWVSYTNLDGGSYRFRVKATNSDGVWSERTLSLPVTVVPPPWRSWWAYLLYGVALCAAISTYLRYRTRQQEQEVRRLHERAEASRKTEELEKARAIQLSLLPDAPPQLDSLDIAAYMKTATEVGGDYYDFFLQEGDDGNAGTLHVAVGDATGHGISAGMMVSMLKAALKALDVQPPHVQLSKLNRVIRAVNPQRMNMALNIARIDIDRNEIGLSSAGMPPCYLLASDSARADSGEGTGGVDPTGIDRSVADTAGDENGCDPAGVDEILIPSLPLGAMEQPDYHLTVLPFTGGDVLVMLSDGLPELRDEHNQELGYEAVQQHLTTCAGKTAQEILEGLLRLGEHQSAGRAIQDDITMVVLRRL